MSQDHNALPVWRLLSRNVKRPDRNTYEVIGHSRVDPENYSFLNQFRWLHARKSDRNGYVFRSTYDGIAGHMRNLHNEVWERHALPIPPGMTVDHMDGDTWNNTHENLRLATVVQQGFNKRIPLNSKYGFKGVHYWARGRVFKASIRCEPYRIHLGPYRIAVEAAFAYNHAASLLHGEFAWLNPIPPGILSEERMAAIASDVERRIATKIPEQGNP
jgi:HNH endonuclease